jgi:thiol-disulfide isomerase/thioredoxin
LDDERAGAMNFTDSFRSPHARWLALTVLMMVAITVAIWPRDRPVVDDASSAREVVVSPSQVRSATPDEPENAIPGAITPECPASPLDSGGVTGELVGVMASCVGSADAVDVGRALAGRPALLNVWASWCAPCRDEIPVLNAYAQSSPAVQVFGVNVDNSPRLAEQLMSQMHMIYPSFGNSDALRQALGGPAVLPLSFVLRADGTVVPVTPISVFDSVHEVNAAVIAASA